MFPSNGDEQRGFTPCCSRTLPSSSRPRIRLSREAACVYAGLSDILCVCEPFALIRRSTRIAHRTG
jgi:hypothetical protein